MIHSDKLELEVFSKELRQKIRRFKDKIQRTCSENHIPYIRFSEGICYFTFAGYLINRSIGLYSRKPDFKADDLSLIVPSPVDWDSIGIYPSNYGEFFHLLFEASAGQSIYQKQLPLDMQEREYLQNWLKDATIPYIISRLVGADPMIVDNEMATYFGFFA